MGKATSKKTVKAPAKPDKSSEKLGNKKNIKASDASGQKTKAVASAAKPGLVEALIQKKSKPAASKKSKNSKKQDGDDLDDGLLSDEVEASEEIPDLAEFNEDESAEDDIEAEDNSSDDGSEDILADVNVVRDGDDEVILTDAEGRRLCRVRDCDQAAMVETYCRFHYLQNWKRIQVRRKILADGKLERYVEELTSRYPDKFLEMIRKDLRSEKDFLTSIAELEIDESAGDSDFEDESQNFIDEVRGVTESTISDDDEF